MANVKKKHRRAGNFANHGLAPIHPDGGGLSGCGRTTSTVFQELADSIQNYLRAQMPSVERRLSGRRIR